MSYLNSQSIHKEHTESHRGELLLIFKEFMGGVFDTNPDYGNISLIISHLIFVGVRFKAPNILIMQPKTEPGSLLWEVIMEVPYQ